MLVDSHLALLEGGLTCWRQIQLLPAPDHVKPYTLQARFLVSSSGAGTLLDWNEPSDPAYATKVFAALRGYKFRAATTADGSGRVRQQLAGFKVPRSIDVRDEPLPKSGAGKLLKHQLRAPHWAGRDRLVG